MSHTLSELAQPLDILPDAVVVVDRTGRILYANGAITTLLGYERGELTGQSVSLLVPKPVSYTHLRAHET